jgi:LmbE family N-acetylglucosaminyl deacetylase
VRCAVAQQPQRQGDPVPSEFPSRPLIFVAHPDDESLAFGGLLQRLPASLVVFATDGAPGGFGLERQFGSLKAYAAVRAEEVARVFRHIPNSSYKRLARPDGSHFSDMHVFEEFPAAAISLRAIAHAFAPDAIISHAYEGAHIDHDACSFLAMHVAASLALRRFECPLYWLDQNGKVVQQQYRDTNLAVRAGELNGACSDALEWRLTEPEIDCKKKMLAEYQTQCGTVAEFLPGIGTERMRLATTNASFASRLCRDYMYQERRPRFYHTRRHRISAKVLLRKFTEFENWQKKHPAWW